MVDQGEAEKDHARWREARQEEIFGPRGKAFVVAKGMISGPELQTIAGVPGQWCVDDAGELTVTAAADDGVLVDDDVVDGTVVVPPGETLAFSPGLTGMAGGTGGAFGVLVFDLESAPRSGVTGLESYPYDPRWIFTGTFVESGSAGTVDIERLTEPRTPDTLPAPVDLVFSIDGVDVVLTVIEEIPGQGTVIFTDETSGAETPAIGRWLTIPLAPAGTEVVVDLNRITLSFHHLSTTVFVCPLPPAGNHIPLRIEAGERDLIRHQPNASTAAESKADNEGDLLMNLTPAEAATTYLGHLENRRWGEARAMCTADATVWHGDGAGDSSIEENISGMKAQIGGIASMVYDIQRQISDDEGVLQQHVVRVETTDGTRMTVYAAAYFGLKDGLIGRIEEYANAVPEFA